MATARNAAVELDMTPMIDVVFELIIFFVVTLKMTSTKDETIRLEDGQHGIVLTPEQLPPSNLTIDIARNGRVSMGNVTISDEMLKQRVKERVRKYGTEFPILIRADYRTQHKYVAQVMNVCTANGVWKLAFVAVAERKSGKSK